MSVWADVRKPLQPDQPPPDMPSVWAVPEEQPQTLASPVPDVRGPHMQLSTDTAQRANLPKLAARQEETNDINKLNDVRWHEANPWGSPENHPGKLGKIAHAFSVLGNVAGNIVAPNVMARIPGTQANMQEREGELANRVDSDVKNQAANEEQEAQTNHLNAQTHALENPADKNKPEKPYTIQTDEGVLQWNPQSNTWTPVTVNGDTAMPFAKPSATRANAFQHVSGTSQGKQVFANYDPSKGTFTDLQGNVLTDFHPTDKAMQGVLGQYAPIKLLQGLLNTAYNDNPALLPYVGKLAQQIMGHYGAGPGVEQAFGTPPEGQPQSDTGTPIGLKMPEAPTGSTRSRGQFAASVIPAINDAQGKIQELGDELGPLAGRYNELATSKIGAFGPQFTELQTTLHNIATAWMRLHANSEGAREDFINQLRAAQSPENLVAALNSIEKQANDYVKVGKGQTAPKRPDSVPPNAKYITDPKTGKKGWAW